MVRMPFETQLVALCLHGVIALAWMGGLVRVSWTREPELRATLLGAAVAWPAVFFVLRLLGLAEVPEALAVVRAGAWAHALVAAGPALTGLGALLAGGTCVIFLLQEAWPVVRSFRARHRAPRLHDDRLDASLERVLGRYAVAGVRRARGRRPEIRCLESEPPLAALDGFAQPCVLLSRGLLRQLDDDELDGVVAHELAHLFQDGNVGVLLLWIARALQAPSPAALVAFRLLVDAREEACDRMAARVTGKPASLASALLRVYEAGVRDVERERATLKQARARVLRRGETYVTRMRVRALLDHPVTPAPRTALALWASALLGALLWGIG